MTVFYIECSSCNIVGPPVSESLSTVSSDPGVTAKMNYLHLSTVRQTYMRHPIFAGQHLLHFFYSNLSELLPVLVLIDIPVVVVREDVVYDDCPGFRINRGLT